MLISLQTHNVATISIREFVRQQKEAQNAVCLCKHIDDPQRRGNKQNGTKLKMVTSDMTLISISLILMKN